MTRRGKRPQPGGWDATVQRLLKPEHVERISDTVVHIHLPPALDFDIDEDETVSASIPGSALSSGKPLRTSFTIIADSHETRIDNALEGLREELAEIRTSGVIARFLLTFATCEIAAKALVSHFKFRGQNRKSLSDKWSTEDIGKALKGLGIGIDDKLLILLFSTEKAVASEMSARSLRDNLVHRMKRVHRVAIRARADTLMAAMDQFLDAVSAWRSK